MRDRQQRLREAEQEALSAEQRGEQWAANEAWTRYLLIKDGSRSPGELLAEAIGISAQVMELARQVRREPR